MIQIVFYFLMWIFIIGNIVVAMIGTSSLYTQFARATHSTETPAFKIISIFYIIAFIIMPIIDLYFWIVVDSLRSSKHS
jgi:hypothetical protein